jgi:serine/threonine protein kinase
LLRQIGPYKLQSAIGRGGLGVVYQATDALGLPCALKLLNRPQADEMAARRMAREFSELSLIQHRNIVRVLDAGVDNDVPFLVMELVDGVPLRRFLDVFDDSVAYAAKPPPLPEDETGSIGDDEAVTASRGATGRGLLGWINGDEEPDSLAPRPKAPSKTAVAEPLSKATRDSLNRPARTLRLRDVMAQLCDGLAFIHAHGLVHRDIKPSNVLVTAAGCAKLVDFGLVKSTFTNGNTTAAGHVVGTYRYMSPEQARGSKVDGRSDLYALGGVLYEMLCSHPPFMHHQAPDLVHAIVYEAPAAVKAMNPEADEVLVGIAERLLQKSPHARFSSAEEVARRLRTAGRRA